jgi:YD repeat-containing protein
VTSINVPDASTKTVTYTYDLAGNLSTLTTNTGTTTTTYDSANRVKTVLESGMKAKSLSPSGS